SLLKLECQRPPWPSWILDLLDTWFLNIYLDDAGRYKEVCWLEVQKKTKSLCSRVWGTTFDIITWSWRHDLVDEFVYQFQSFYRYCAKNDEQNKMIVAALCFKAVTGYMKEINQNLELIRLRSGAKRWRKLFWLAATLVLNTNVSRSFNSEIVVTGNQMIQYEGIYLASSPATSALSASIIRFGHCWPIPLKNTNRFPSAMEPAEPGYSVIGNLKVYKVVLEKDSEISKVKKEKYKSLALKERKLSSDEEISCSESDDEEYAMAVIDFKKFFRRRGKFVRQPHDDKKNFRKIKEDKKEKKDRRCFKCADPNHFISDCPKHSYSDKKTFVVGCWSDSEDDSKNLSHGN
ncbi:zf-CCHC domain-containing protein, partial [Tanacetum coccineum]